MREAKIQKDKEVNSQESGSSESYKIRKAPHQRLMRRKHCWKCLHVGRGVQRESFEHHLCWVGFSDTAVSKSAAPALNKPTGPPHYPGRHDHSFVTVWYLGCLCTSLKERIMMILTSLLVSSCFPCPWPQAAQSHRCIKSQHLSSFLMTNKPRLF